MVIVGITSIAITISLNNRMGVWQGEFSLFILVAHAACHQLFMNV